MPADADAASAAPPSPGRPRRPPRRTPWWLLAILLLGLIVLWSIVANDGYRTIFVALSGGIVTTLWVTFVAFALACLLGLVVAMARTSPVRPLEEVATFYIEIVRGIPVLVVLFYIAFVGAPVLVDAINWVIGPLVGIGWLAPLSIRTLDFTWRAIIALMVCYSSFIAEVFRAGIEAVPAGQSEAAFALGLSRWLTLRKVVAPQALRTILPPLGNDFVSMIKDSALVSALGVQDITQLGKVYSSGTFKFFETYNVVAFLYLVMTISLSLLVRLLESRLKRGQN
jgi:polar amino acid transport system permease protein